MIPTKYVVTFLFNSALDRVALIRKLKPEWQRGLLNGIGGKIEPGETPAGAAARELFEESGLILPEQIFKRFCCMHGTNNDGTEFEVEFFYLTCDLSALKTTTDEMVEIHPTEDIVARRLSMVGNVPWLVSLALDFLNGVYPPSIVLAQYKPQLSILKIP